MTSKTDTFITKANKVHKNKYSYLKTDYKLAKSKVIITCSEHGDFEQTPSNHLLGNGCLKCRGKSQENLLKDFIKTHKNKYDYSKVCYKGARSKVIIICPIHGEFIQDASNHIQGKGCPSCGDINRISNLTKSKKQVINEFKKIHNNTYNYREVEYLGSHTNINIICPIHGSFKQTPANHLTGSGCPKCAKYGFNTSKPAILYYIKLVTTDDKVLYKIGITNRMVNERFSLKELKIIQIIKQETFALGQEAYDKEQEILKKYSKYKYKGPRILSYGNTELFTCNVFDLL